MFLSHRFLLIIRNARGPHRLLSMKRRSRRVKKNETIQIDATAFGTTIHFVSVTVFTAASFRGALGRFGGAVWKFSNIAIILQISISGNTNTAMLYDAELQNRLAKYTREWTPPGDYYPQPSTLQVDILRIAAQRAAHPSISRAPPPGK